MLTFNMGSATILALAIGLGSVIVSFVLIRKTFGADIDTLRTGIPCQAKILKVWQTGAYMGRDPQLGMEVEVIPQSGAPYAAQTKAVVLLINIPKFQPGALIPVKVSVKDRTRVVLDRCDR